MDGIVLVARAYGARKDWQRVVEVLYGAEQACSEAAAAATGGGADTPYGKGRGDGDGNGVVVARHPPSELYETVARSLALAGKWEEAADAVRKLEVRYCCTV